MSKTSPKPIDAIDEWNQASMDLYETTKISGTFDPDLVVRLGQAGTGLMIKLIEAQSLIRDLVEAGASKDQSDGKPSWRDRLARARCSHLFAPFATGQAPCGKCGVTLDEAYYTSLRRT